MGTLKTDDDIARVNEKGRGVVKLPYVCVYLNRKVSWQVWNQIDHRSHREYEGDRMVRVNLASMRRLDNSRTKV